MIKKAALSLFLIVTFSTYVSYRRFGVSDTSPIDPKKLEPQPISARVLMPAPPPTPPVSQSNNPGQYKDGQYTGKVADAYYGNVQVRAFIQNGKIFDVHFLQYPSDRRTSIEINTQAMPYLRTEAIKAQNANVDIISGATATSGAFQESLKSALSQALN